MHCPAGLVTLVKGLQADLAPPRLLSHQAKEALRHLHRHSNFEGRCSQAKVKKVLDCSSAMPRAPFHSQPCCWQGTERACATCRATNQCALGLSGEGRSQP